MKQLLAPAAVILGITLVLQCNEFWVEALGAVLIAFGASYMGYEGAK